MLRNVKIGNREIGFGKQVLISFEAGATHDGVETAKKLIDAAVKAGADAIKFQSMLTDELMSEESKSTIIEYSTPLGKSHESVYNALKRRELNFEEWKEIREYCRQYGLLFISTPSGKETIDWLVELKADAIKISKSDVNNYPLIEYAASTMLPIILDAREKFEEVENGINICEEQKNFNIIVMHCPSGYPAEHSGIHLNVIPEISSIFGYPSGYSDHSVGTAMNYTAIGLGVNMIEKGITLDRSIDAVEHYTCLDTSELKDFVETIRAIENALGNKRVIFNSRVNPVHRRSIFLKKDIKEGKAISMDDVCFLRPGNYIPVSSINEIIGKKATTNLKAKNPLRPTDFN